MVDIEKLSEDDFDSIVTDALDLFKEVAENSLSANDEELYARLARLLDDDDYELNVSLRNLDENDEYEEEDINNIDSYVIADIELTAVEGSLKDDVHAASVMLSVDKDEAYASVSWFPDN